jgi:NAD(P)-dependent dehydrogenase (short-subunit alcohol dehydrogenase family)
MLLEPVVLITGANGGLGRTVTRAFLASGARVTGVALAMSAAELSHHKFSGLSAEIRSAGDATRIVDQVVAAWGRVDAFVHLVGGYAGGSRVDEVDATEYLRMMDLNAWSFLHMARAVIPRMRAQKSGSLLAVGSRAAIEPTGGVGAYAASKAALISLVRTVAVENKDLGISANVILPGTIDTPANRAAMPEVDPGVWVDPAQIASLAVQLVSPSLSQVTGSMIPIYGRSL